MNAARRHATVLALGALIAGAPLRGEEPTMDERIRRIVDGPLFAAVDPAVEVEVRPEIAYTDEGVSGPRLDVYRPKEGGAERRPAWIFVHGGPIPPAMGAIRPPRTWRFFRDYGALSAAAGRVGVVLDHRYGALDDIPRSEADVRAGVAWVRAHAAELGVDPERVSLWLFSGAGVQLPSLLADPPAGVRGLAAFYPAVEPDVLAAMGVGAVPDAMRSRASVAAPDPGRAPRLFLARAGLDHPALNAALDRLAASLLGAGLSVELANHPHGHHGFEILDDDARTREVIESAVRFLVRGESAEEPLPRVVRPTHSEP